MSRAKVVKALWWAVFKLADLAAHLSPRVVKVSGEREFAERVERSLARDKAEWLAEFARLMPDARLMPSDRPGEVSFRAHGDGAVYMCHIGTLTPLQASELVDSAHGDGELFCVRCAGDLVDLKGN